MVSVKNPNVPSKNRQTARASKARKHQQKRASESNKNKVAKADTKRGARTGILPTSGPNAAKSAKKLKRIERRRAAALKRQMEAEGEVEMKDFAQETATKKSEEKAAAQPTDVDMDNIE